LPTAIQAQKAAILAQYISNGYQPIQLFRYNPQAKYIYIIAGIEATIEAIIYENGNWEFLTDE
jgi:hypothetical protein